MTIRKKTLLLTYSILLISLAVDFYLARAFFPDSSHIITWFLATSATISIVLSATLLLMLSRIVLDPLDRLNRQVAALESNTTGIEVDLPGSQELDNLARSINGTLNRLRSSEDRYRLFVQNFNGIAFRVHLGGDVIFLHGAVETITGYTTEEISNRSPAWRTIVHPEEQTRFNLLTTELVAHPGTSMELEYRIIRKDGKVRWICEVASAEVGTTEKSLIIQGALYDSTHRKNAEESLIQARDESERANRTKSEFLATMSHELRTPLTAILGLAESLQAQAEAFSQAQRRSLGIIETSGYHLLSLINDLLDLSRIESGKMEFYPQTVNLEALCRTSFRFMAGQAAAKRIGLTLSLEQAPTELVVDSRRLTQVLINLLSNAVKFTPVGGVVGLQAAVYPDAGVVSFTVWDTGIGINRDDQEALFTPFKQVENVLAQGNEGTGLGLALVSRMVGLQGGQITLESEIGIGSRFTVTLPWQSPVATPENKAVTATPVECPEPITPETAQPPDGPRILVTEDNDTTREMTSEFLGGKGYRVCQARNGEEALEQVAESPPDLIIMDVNMPGMDGVEAISRIRKIPGQRGDIPIIALTAQAMAGDRKRCVEAGATAYFTKPVRLGELCHSIATILKSR
jgi:PAS domain S-box-containing protein